MTQISDKIKIYKFNGLSRLRKDDYNNYLVVCYETDKNKGIYYQFRNEIQADDFKKYLGKNLGITDEYQMNELLNLFNEAVKNKSYDELNLVQIKNYQSWDTAITDKGIMLNTYDKWYKRGNK